MQRSRTGRQLRVALFAGAIAVVAGVGAGCTTFSDAERTEIAEAGETQLARHVDDELVLPLPLDALTLSGEETESAAAISGESGPLTQWSDQVAPSRHRYTYSVSDSVELADVLDEAVAYLSERGAAVVDESSRQRTLKASSLGDEIVIELRAATRAGDLVEHWVTFGPPG